MKRYNLIILALISGTLMLNAQNQDDLLRYSRNFYLGTARSVGLAGAVGSLGGDYTSVLVNPGSLGVYRGSEMTVTPFFNWNVTSTDFLDNVNEETKRSFSIANLGFVRYNDLGRESGWISTAFAVGYNNISNYNQRSFMGGINNTNSFLDDFTGLSDDENSGEYLFYKNLAFEDSLLVYNSETGQYSNDFEIDGYGQYQSRLINSTGSAGTVNFSFGANYNHKVYMGASFLFNRIRNERSFTHTEDDEAGTIAYVDKFIFIEDQMTRGYGVGLNLGAVVRPIDFLKIGAAFQTPSIYFLNDRFTTELTAYYDDYEPYTAYSPFGDSDYRIITPSKFTGSATATIGKVALFSIDYEYIDYSKAKIESDQDRYSDINEAVKNLYKAASNIKLGGEVRLSSVYLRGGYAHYGTPYGIVDPAANESNNILSFGIGFRSGKTFADFGYSTNSSEQAYYMYKSQVANGSVNTYRSNTVLLTVGFKF